MFNSKSLSLDLITRESVSHKVYDVLKDRILTGELAPGTHLVEALIAEKLGTSRGPVREAIRELETDGLVVIKPNIGTFIHSPGVNEIREIYTIRVLLESYAAQLAADCATPDSIIQLRQIMEAIFESAKESNIYRTVQLDFALHRQIWKMASHQILYESLSRLENPVRLFISLQAPLFEKLFDSISDHLEIIDAIANGDGKTASELSRDHIKKAAQLIISHLDNEEGFLPDKIWPLNYQPDENENEIDFLKTSRRKL